MAWMSAGMMDLAASAAASDVPVLILGEEGVGKKTLARKIHELSSRAKAPFVAIKCAGLAEHLLRDVIFGGTTPGALHSAGGGYFVLDEAGYLPLELQKKLLVSARRGAFADVVLIAMTNPNLEEEVARERVLPEFVAWVGQKVLGIPPLRDRRSEIFPLARHFAAEAAERMGRPVPKITPEAATLLQSRWWPWNVRQLWVYIERAMILGNGRIDVAHL